RRAADLDGSHARRHPRQTGRGLHASDRYGRADGVHGNRHARHRSLPEHRERDVRAGLRADRVLHDASRPSARPERAHLEPSGFSLGHFGVDIFVVVSGYLVTGSLLARDSLGAFLRARALRIFPALVANAFGTAFVIGAFVTAWPLARYFAAWGTWRYALQNST